jgi:hypothetical protein
MTSPASILSKPILVTEADVAVKLKPYSRFRLVTLVGGREHTGETISTIEFERVFQQEITNLVAVEGYNPNRPYGDHWDRIR